MPLRLLATPTYWFAAVLLLAVGGCRSAAVPSDDLAARILDNLRVEYPTIADVEVSVDSLRAAGADGLMEGQLSIPGQAPQPFLYVAPTERLYLLAAPPVDVSRDSVAVAAAIASRDSLEAAEARSLAERIARETADLPARGPADAPITIVEFSDFQCPYCARAAGTVAQVLAANADVRLVYAHLPLGNHAWARPAALASTCAAQQNDNAFWALHDLYFRDQRALTPANVIDRSRDAIGGQNLDLAAWDTCVRDTGSDAHQRALASVAAQEALAADAGVTGTPGFFINGAFINGAQPAEVFQQAIDDARRR